MNNILTRTSFEIQHKDSPPPLNQAQITKLKHLTPLSLAMDRRVCG